MSGAEEAGVRLERGGLGEQGLLPTHQSFLYREGDRTDRAVTGPRHRATSLGPPGVGGVESLNRIRLT